MSITNALAEQFANSPAVLCCRRVKGTVLSPEDLEDPSIFPDMIESGLIQLSEDVLNISDVLGKTLAEDVEGLTALGAAHLLNYHDNTKASKSITSIMSPIKEKIHIEIDQLSGLRIDIPMENLKNIPSLNPQKEVFEECTEEIVNTLTKREFKVKDVQLGEKTEFENGVLTIRKDLCQDALKADPLVKKLEIDIIHPDNRHVYSNTIMDIIPIATKVEGQLGEGITHLLAGTVFVLTGVDEAGVQVHEFGSCEGYLDEKIDYGKPGCPDAEDIMIRIHAIIQEKTGMERRGPHAAHKACDHIIQEIRDLLKQVNPAEASQEKLMNQVKRHGRPRVLLVKEIMGQGAMHDNVMLPTEPAGVMGGRQNVDLGNVPVVLSVNEVRDGGIHALTCIGPASKEDTRHYFREPVLELLAEDDELDLVGVAFIGSPQVNDEKAFVSKRLGAMAETMKLDGAIVTTEGFGNNHIDFSYNIEEIGKRGINVVGMTYAAYQGQLVVGNAYMDAMVEVNKDAGGFESEILGQNTITHSDAKRAVAMLKNKIAGVSIEAADKKWNQFVIDDNQTLVDKKRG